MMKKSICKSAIGTMVCISILGGCGQIGGESQEMQSSSRITSMSSVVISENGTDSGETMPSDASASGSGTMPSDASASGSETMPSGASASGSGGTSDNVLTTNQSDRSDSPEEEMMRAYQDALEKLYTDDLFPDGKQYGTSDGMYEKTNNCFAIYDIDFDGKEELIIQYVDTIMAGMIEMIYHYDNTSGELTVELSEFPALTFYDNGVVKAELSHNHGLGGDFWPYTVYQYDKEADIYAEVGRADAWDQNFYAVDDNGNPFPKEIDVNGDGIVYYVMGGEYTKNTIVDLEEYNQWWDSMVEGAKEIEIPFQKLKDYAQSYAVCTSKSVWEVERFARKIKELILTGDFEGLSKEIAYPVTINGTIYQDEAAFLKTDFAENLNPEILTELEAESCQGMFANGQGIMLGNGSVWIGESMNPDLISQGLKVITLNNFTSTGTGK